MNKRLKHFRHFLNSARGHLTLTYLLIIMVMSIGFSFVFYHASSHELGRQIPPNSFFDKNARNDDGTGAGSVTISPQTQQQNPNTINQFLQQRADEGRSDLLRRLAVLNLVAFLIGSGLSYYLARKNLQPIEEAMEAQAQFVSDASHELRTPLTAIQASNEVALRSKHLTLKVARELIHRNTEDVVKLKNLSEALLNLASHTKVELGTTELSEVVSGAMGQVVAPATDKKMNVEDNVPKLTVHTEKHRLEEALVILLDNAIKYSPAESTVTLDAEHRGKFVYLHVRDQGIGIRASDLPHIFRRFYRADTARTGGGKHTGYGLGLAIARELMSQLDGDVQVESVPGSGSVFTLKIPFAKS